MKRTLSEKKALKMLGITDFRHITKDKVVEFAPMLPDLGPEVAKKALDQFPSFKEMATELVNAYSNAYNRALESNKDSQRAVYDTINSIIQVLSQELQSDEISSEDRERIENKLIQLAQMAIEVDKRNKEFNLTALRTLGLSVVAVIGSTLIFIGANMQVSKGTDDEEDDDVIEGEYTEK